MNVIEENKAKITGTAQSNRLLIELDDSTAAWLRALAKANRTTAPALLEYMASCLADYAGRNPNDAAKHIAVLLVRGGLDELIQVMERYNLKSADVLRNGQKSKKPSPEMGKGIAP